MNENKDDLSDFVDLSDIDNLDDLDSLNDISDIPMDDIPDLETGSDGAGTGDKADTGAPVKSSEVKEAEAEEKKQENLKEKAKENNDEAAPADAPDDSSLDELLSDMELEDSESNESNPDIDAALAADNTASEEEKGESKKEKKKKEKKKKDPEEPGLLKKLFGNIVNDDIIAEEKAEALKEAEEAKTKEQEALEAKEAAEATKAEKKEAAAKAKADKKAAAAAAAARKKADADAKKRAKAAKKAELEREEQFEVTGKLNKVGVAIVMLIACAFLVVEINGTNVHGYSATVSDARRSVEKQDYTDAYNQIVGTVPKSENDKKLYEQIKTVMMVERSLDSYENYEKMGFYPDALNALLKGIQRYDSNISKAKELKVSDQLKERENQIFTILEDEFGLSEAEARDILALDRDTYTKKVVEIGSGKR
jgi:chemotaxis protein histidine kinase CheA